MILLPLHAQPSTLASPGHGRRRARAVFVVCGGLLLHLPAPAQPRGAPRHGAGQVTVAPPAAPGRQAGGLPLSRVTPPHNGYLGIGLRDLDAAEESALPLHGKMGAMIISVDHDAPAWTAGLRPGDIVTEFDGEPVEDVDGLRRYLRACTDGRAITLRVLHDGQETTIPVTLGNEQAIAQRALSQHLLGAAGPANDGPFATPAFTAPAPVPVAPASGSQRSVAATLLDTLIPESAYTGLEVSTLTPQLAAYFGVHGSGGLLVTGVRSGSPAQAAGLLAGDIILRAADMPMATRGNLAHAVREGRRSSITLAVLRNRRELSLTLTPGKHRGR